MPSKKPRSGKEKLTPISPGKLLKLFKLCKYKVVGRSGSHVTMKHPNKRLLLTIPMHKGQDIRPPLIRSLIKNAGITRTRYLKLLAEL